MKSLCHVTLMCALCLETWAVSGFLYEKLFSYECQLQGLSKFGGHSEAFLVNGLKYANTRLDLFLAIGKINGYKQLESLTEDVAKKT